MDPLPSVNQACSMILQDESQKAIIPLSSSSSMSNGDNTALLGKSGPIKNQKSRFIGECNHYHKMEHKENY